MLRIAFVSHIFMLTGLDKYSSTLSSAFVYELHRKGLQNEHLQYWTLCQILISVIVSIMVPSCSCNHCQMTGLRETEKHSQGIPVSMGQAWGCHSEAVWVNDWRWTSGHPSTRDVIRKAWASGNDQTYLEQNYHTANVLRKIQKCAVIFPMEACYADK